MKKRLITMPKRILAGLAVLLLGLVTVSPAYADTHTGETTDPTFTFVALPLPTPTYGTGELAIQRTSAPDATSYRFTATILGNGVFIGTNGSRTSELNTDPQHGGASSQYVICVPETVMINVTDSNGAVVASLEAGANKAGSKDLRSCPEGPTGPVDTDLDGVPNDTDNCDDVAGPASNGGCPVDTDGDGVIDHIDNCDNASGPASNGGCPVVVPEPVDSDNDGVNNDIDNCDNEAGPASNGGCPVVVPEPVDVSPKKAAVCKYVGTPGVDERLQTGQNPIVVDRKDWMVIGSPFQDAHGRSIVIAFLNAQDPEPSVDQCPTPVVDACPEMDGIQAPGTDCTPVVVPDACPPGMGWKDTNGNNKVDEGECSKRVPPISGPPVVVPPVVVPPVVTPPVVVPPVVVPPVVAPPVDVVVNVVPDDSTDGRGFRVETAVSGTATEGATSQSGTLLAGLAALLLIATAFGLKRSVTSK